MRITFLLFSLILCFTASSQSTNYKIDGIIVDTFNNPLIYSTVLLLEKSDSTMIDFTRSELDGSFRFKDVPFGNHIVKTTYVGYIPLTIDASSDKDNVDLGSLSMKEMASELMEVVIKAAKAPIKMRGDTIEYDASTFKVPEGSSVEDLLKRLPGMEVESDGSILADGKSVTRVTVDGKDFFGSDPKAATKNLPAEGISKVQVFDTKTEEEEITGATSQSQDKTMNLELKEEFKSGGFGKVIAGIGTENTKELKGNYNKFNKKIQFSLVGVGNNTGRNGLSWDDYQDFMGSQSFNFSDGGDYGFGGGGGMYYFGGGGSGIESSIQSIFFGADNSAGLPENYNGGLNFNYDHDKTKVSAVYYYNLSGLKSEKSLIRDKFITDFTQNETQETFNDDRSQGHRVELKFEKELDSLLTIKTDFNGAFIDQEEQYTGDISLARDGQLRSSSDINNLTNKTGYLGNGLVLIRKKFKKKGRSMGLNTSYLSTQLKEDQRQNSTINFYNQDATIDSTTIIERINNDVADKNLIKANALFVEPLSKKFFFETFYNFSNRVESGERTVLDIEDFENTLNPFLSREYENTLLYNRIGSSLRYSHNGINVSLGLGYQTLKLNGQLQLIGISEPSTTIDKTFNNFIPNLSINMSPVRNSYVSINYSRNVNEPEITDLQPFVDNSNPLYIVAGNPSLTPEISNRIGTYMSRSYPLGGVRLSLNGNITLYENQISRNEIVDENLITTVTPVNIDGGNSTRISGSINFPIVKNKLTARMRMGANSLNANIFVNGIKNETQTIGYTPFMKLSFTPNDDMALYINANYRVTNITYDIQTTQNQTTKQTTLGVEFNTKLFGGLFFDSQFNMNYYSNDRFNTSQNIPILNASIYKQVLKGNKGEVRLSIYDAFNQNQGFFQGGSGNQLSQSSTVALAQYVMLGFTYNIRGIKSDVRQDSWW